MKQDGIPVGCVPPARFPTVSHGVSVLGDGVGAGVGGGEVPCLGWVPTPWTYLPPRHTHPWTYPPHPPEGICTRDTHSQKKHGIRDTHPILCEQTDTCENITFPQLRLRAVIAYNCPV